MGIFEVIHPHIYPFDVCISINQSDEEVLKSLENNDGDWSLITNLPETCVARFVMSPSNLTVIRLFIENTIPHNYIAHEIFHVVTFIMDRVGIKLKLMVSDEAYAYLIGYLTEQIYKVISDHFVDANKMV